MAHQSQFVLLLAGNIVFICQIFRCNAHMIPCDRAAQAFLGQGIHHLHITHAEAGAAVQAKIRRAGHNVGAHHHGQLTAVRQQAPPDDIQRFHTGGALLIHRIGPCFGRDAALDFHLTAGVSSVAVLIDTAHTQLIDILGLHAGTLHSSLGYRGAQIYQRNIL